VLTFQREAKNAAETTKPRSLSTTLLLLLLLMMMTMTVMMAGV